jgi:hypothetical protein
MYFYLEVLLISVLLLLIVFLICFLECSKYCRKISDIVPEEGEPVARPSFCIIMSLSLENKSGKLLITAAH